MGLLDIFKSKKGTKEETREEIKEEIKEENGEQLDFLNPDDVTEYIIKQISEITEEENTRKDNGIFFPKWNVFVQPQVRQVTEKGIILDILINAPQWGKDLYECTVGMGSDPQSNIGLALGSFIFSFMQGIAAMEEHRDGISIETKFSGNIHKWNVYRTDIVGMGNEEMETSVDVYWNELMEDILNHLGNQKLSYIKIFASKMGDDITGECRIDDIVSMELSKKVAQIARNWDVQGFVSQKQFFFIRQDEETIINNPYEGEEGFKLLKEKVALAAKMFYESETEEEYNSLPARLMEALEDPVLGYECYAFLPEICTENAFPDAQYAEYVKFVYPDGRKENVYKSQLADYEILRKALFTIFSEGVFGDDTNNIYQEYVGSSATYNCFSQMMENGSDIKYVSTTALAFMVDDGFIIR